MGLIVPDGNGNLSITDTTDDEVLNDIGSDTIDCRAYGKMTVQVGLSGGSVIAFDQFEFVGETNNSGVFSQLVTVWTTPVGPFEYGDDLKTLPHGSTRFAVIDLSAIDEIKFRSAQAGVTASVVTRLLNMFFERTAG